MWDTVWAYGNRSYVDEQLAKECGLAVVQMTVSGCQFLGLTGCGMDLSPQLVAYQALNFHYIDESDVFHFTSKSKREYFRHVVGSTVYNKVLDVLGIADAVKYHEEKEA